MGGRSDRGSSRARARNRAGGRHLGLSLWWALAENERLGCETH